MLKSPFTSSDASATVMWLPNGLQSHSPVTEKLVAGIDTDAWYITVQLRNSALDFGAM